MLIFFIKHFGKKYVLVGYFIRLAVVFRALMDVLINVVIRLLDRFLPEGKKVEIPYMRFDLRNTSVTDMLSALRKQDVSKKSMRSLLETVSYDGTMLIRHNEVIPLQD
jgi:hypothetical protein